MKLHHHLFFIALIIILINSIGNAQEYSIEGSINIKGLKKPGILYINLVDEKIFSTPLDGIRKIKMTIDRNKMELPNIRFNFKGLTKGTYGIRFFIDTDKNGKLNKGLLGPSEPWGMSWNRKRPFGWPKFKYISFKITEPITKIEMNVEH